MVHTWCTFVFVCPHVCVVPTGWRCHPSWSDQVTDFFLVGCSLQVNSSCSTLSQLSSVYRMSVQSAAFHSVFLHIQRDAFSSLLLQACKWKHIWSLIDINIEVCGWWLTVVSVSTLSSCHSVTSLLWFAALAGVSWISNEQCYTSCFCLVYLLS